MELPAVGQDTIVSSTSLPLLREVLSDYTKLVSEVFKLHTRQRLGQHICNLLICANILELYNSSLHHITNVVIPDLYVLRLIMEHWFSIIFMQLWLSHRIMVASISRSNRPVNNFRSHMASQLAEHATMYSASTLLRAILDCFLLCHEVMADPRLKQHPEVLFLSETLPAQSESSITIQSEVMISNITETIIQHTLKVSHHMLCSYKVNTSGLYQILTQGVHNKAYIWPGIRQIHQRTNNLSI
jgi:hypothetical protein